jgi:hypothetical protein
MNRAVLTIKDVSNKTLKSDLIHSIIEGSQQKGIHYTIYVMFHLFYCYLIHCIIKGTQQKGIHYYIRDVSFNLLSRYIIHSSVDDDAD